MKKFFLLVCLGISLFWFFSGCGGSSEKAQDAADSTITIAVIPMGTTHEFWKAIHAGAQTAAREIGGIDIIWKGPLKEDDRDEQIQLVENFITAKVDAIVLAPLDDRALIRPVLEAKNRNIPTILVDSKLQEDVYASFLATNNYKGGCMGAEYIGKLMGGKGTLIMVRVYEGAASASRREDGFLATINKIYPDIEILSSNQYGGITTETAYRTVENLLNRFPDVEAIFTPNESTTFGCLRALQDRGLAGKVIFVGFDSSGKLIEAMEREELRGLIVQNPFNMGYLGIKTAVACVRGEAFELEVDTGVTLTTPENMNDPEIRKLLVPDLSILDE